MSPPFSTISSHGNRRDTEENAKTHSKNLLRIKGSLLNHKNKAVAHATAEALNVTVGERQTVAGVSRDVHGAVRAHGQTGGHGGSGGADKGGEQQRGFAGDARPELRQKHIGAAPPVPLRRRPENRKV